MNPRGPLAAIFLITLGLPGLRTEICSVDEAQKPQVTYLLERMLASFDPTATPNPSILLALRLASQHNLEIEHAMVLSLKEDAVERVVNNQPFTSGTVALYVLALQSSCENPREVTANNSTINLVQILNEKYAEELNNIETHQQPLTNYYQIGLDILALCQEGVAVRVAPVLRVSCPEWTYGHGEDFSVDTAAVMVLGLTCLKRECYTLIERMAVRSTMVCLVQKILQKKQNDGVIGNIYSTGLAMQALFVSKEFYSPSQWNCTQTLATIVQEISEGAFNNPMAASQLTPSLEGRTYLDSRGLNCSADQDNLPLISTPTPPPITNLSDITVFYTVVDSVTNTFHNSITVDVPDGSTFLVVMETAQSLNSMQFSFTVESSSWGPYVTSINGLTASDTAHTYWQLLNDTTPLIQGVGDYKPSNGEQLVAKFTTW